MCLLWFNNIFPELKIDHDKKTEKGVFYLFDCDTETYFIQSKFMLESGSFKQLNIVQDSQSIIWLFDLTVSHFTLIFNGLLKNVR